MTDLSATHHPAQPAYLQSFTALSQQITSAESLPDLSRRVVSLLQHQGYEQVRLLRYDSENWALTLAAHATSTPEPVEGTLTGRAAVTALTATSRVEPTNSTYELAIPIKWGLENSACQTQALEYFIRSGCAAMVVAAIEPALTIPLAHRARQCGLRVIALSSDLGQANQDAFVTGAEYEMGANLGRQAAAWAQEHIPPGQVLQVAVLNFRPVPQVIDREKGILTALAEGFAGAIEVVANETAADSFQALPLAEKWLQTYPGLNMILGVNDATALGAYEAVIAAGRNDPATFFIGGVDATDEALSALAERGAFQATVDLSPQTMGAISLISAVAATQGLPFEPRFNYPTQPVNPANLNEFLASRMATQAIDTQIETLLHARPNLQGSLQGLTIGISVISLHNPFFQSVVREMRRVADRLGVDLLVNDPRSVWGVLHIRSSRPVAGASIDQQYLEALCTQIGLTINNIQISSERTQLLSTLEHRNRQLQIAADVSRAVSSILDPDELMQGIVDLVRNAFNLYYAGLFMVETVAPAPVLRSDQAEPGAWAILRAGTGEAGRQMLAQGHRLKIDLAQTEAPKASSWPSMIGWCIANRQARIDLDVGLDAVHFRNPLLPLTRSELALPLISRGEVIGALTIQSTQEAAFTQEDIAIFQAMTGQIANAIENARLFQQTQTTLQEIEATYRRYLQQEWSTYAQQARTAAYEITSRDEPPTSRDEPPTTLTAPITLRGETIGALGILDNPGRAWTAEELTLVQAIAERVALAAENLRLFEETQRRATLEKLTAEVTARIRETLDIEAVLKTATHEVQKALGLPEVIIRLSDQALRPGSSPAPTTQAPPVAGEPSRADLPGTDTTYRI